jgi:hypothetical protein
MRKKAEESIRLREKNEVVPAGYSSLKSKLSIVICLAVVGPPLCHQGQCQDAKSEQTDKSGTKNEESEERQSRKEELKPFSSPTGHFSVLFQGRPEYEKVTTGELVLNRYVHGEQGNRYFISFSELGSAPSSPRELQIWLNRYCALAAQNVGGQITGTYSVQLAGKIPGRQLEGTIARGVFRLRFFIVGNRLYELYAGGKKTYVDSPLIAQFFNSLKVPN